MSWLSNIWSWFLGLFSADKVKQIQAATVEACSFLPTAASVANILAANNPTLITAEGIALAICTAIKGGNVEAAPAATVIQSLMAPGEAPAVVVDVQGLKVEGSFVGKKK
jgi:hypothetical protein